MRRIREWTLLGGGGVLSLALLGGGEPVRGAVVAALGAVGAALVSRAQRWTSRWPRLAKVIGREIDRCDERLDSTLDAAEDALLAISIEGAPFGRALDAVREGVIDLTRRACGLARVRAGHEATLARIFLETHASQLELAARSEHARVSAELDQIRGALVTIGPSVRHLGLITRTSELASGQAASEVEERVASLREALSEELSHA
jgi:hypothetical protein